MTITLPAELLAAARQEATASGVSLSVVVGEAVAAALRGRLADVWLSDHQAVTEPFGEDELRVLAAEVGVPYAGPVARRC